MMHREAFCLYVSNRLIKTVCVRFLIYVLIFLSMNFMYITLPINPPSVLYTKSLIWNVPRQVMICITSMLSESTKDNTVHLINISLSFLNLCEKFIRIKSISMVKSVMLPTKGDGSIFSGLHFIIPQSCHTFDRGA